MHETLKTNRGLNKNIKAMLVINPQEPLGTVMSTEEIEEVVKFAEENSLVLIVSEKLQNSVYEGSNKKFVSFRKVVSDLNSPVELISFTSISRGPFF